MIDESSNRPALDPKNSKSRLLECAKCLEPVVTSGWSGRVIVRCGYCSFEDERELVVETVEVRRALPYRDKEASGRKRSLTLDLSRALAGHDLASLDPAKLRASCARQALIEDARADVEWERVWMATWLALLLVARGDTLRARVALETTLEATGVPAYRALLLAHLAQHAAFVGATALAKKWLAACPDVAIAEVSSEVKAARAMIAWVKGRTEQVRDLTGGDCPGAGFVGGAKALAIALNLAAHERIGDRKATQARVLDVVRRGLLDMTWIHRAAFQLELKSIGPLVRRARLRTVALTAATTTTVFVAIAMFAHRSLPATLSAAALTGIVKAAFDALLFKWKSAPGRFAWMRRSATWLVGFLCMTGGASWLAHQPRAPAIAAAVEEPSANTGDGRDAMLAKQAEAALGNNHRADAIALANQCLGINPTNDICRRIAAAPPEPQQGHEVDEEGWIRALGGPPLIDVTPR